MGPVGTRKMAVCALASHNCIYENPPTIFVIFWFFGMVAGLISTGVVGWLIYSHITVARGAKCAVSGVKQTKAGGGIALFGADLPRKTHFVIRVLLVTPTYALTGIITVFVPEMGPVCQFIQACVLALSFMNFCYLIVWTFGGPREMVTSIMSQKEDDPSMLQHPPCCCVWYPLKLMGKLPERPTATIMLSIKYGILQWVVVTPFLSFWTITYETVTVESAHSTINTVTSVLQLISTLSAMYAIKVFAALAQKKTIGEMFHTQSKYNFVFGHFICVQILGGIINLFADQQVLSNGDIVTKTQMVSAWTAFFIVLFTLPLSVLAWAAFPTSDEVKFVGLAEYQRDSVQDDIDLCHRALGLAALDRGFENEAHGGEADVQKYMTDHISTEFQDADEIVASILADAHAPSSPKASTDESAEV